MTDNTRPTHVHGIDSLLQLKAIHPKNTAYLEIVGITDTQVLDWKIQQCLLENVRDLTLCCRRDVKLDPLVVTTLNFHLNCWNCGWMYCRNRL